MFDVTDEDSITFDNQEIELTNNDAMDDDILDLDGAFERKGRDSDEIDNPRTERNKPNRAEKRINQLVYERNVLKQQNEEIQRRLAQLEEKANKLDEQTSHAGYESKKAALLEELRIARAADDLDEEQKVQERLTALYVEKNQPRQAKQPEPAPDPAPKQEHSPLAHQWMAENEWAQNPKNFRVVNDIYQKLQNEGFDINDPETYEELSHRVKQMTNRRPQQGAGITDQNPVNTGSRSTAGFTNEDRRAMLNIGLNPDNKHERTEYLLNKAKFARSRALQEY